MHPKKLTTPSSRKHPAITQAEAEVEERPKEEACKEAPIPQLCRPTEEAEAMEQLAATVAAEDKLCVEATVEAMAVPAVMDKPCVAMAEATVELVEAMEATEAKAAVVGMVAALVVTEVLPVVADNKQLPHLHRKNLRMAK